MPDVLAAGGARMTVGLDVLDEVGRDEEPAPAVAPIDHLAHRWAMYLYAQAKAKEWAQVAKDARADLEEALGDSEEGTIGDEPVVRFYWRKTRRLNQKALKAEHPDIVELYTEPTEERRFEPVAVTKTEEQS